MINCVTLVGNLVANPELKEVKAGKEKISLVKFAIAVNRNDDEVSYFNVESWGKLAEIINEHFEKGDRIALSGELKQDRWENEDGESRSMIKVIAKSIEFMTTKEDKTSKSKRK